MTLAAGTRLGAYNITALIGVGGMGEVYRATDTNLKAGRRHQGAAGCSGKAGSTTSPRTRPSAQLRRP